MTLDLARFFRACDPTKILSSENEEDRYYIDLSSVRGGKLIEEFQQAIALSPDQPTCQLFTAHIGCWKFQELKRLKAELEKQGFHVVYCKASLDLDLEDVDLSDILLMLTRQVSTSLEALGIKLKSRYFTNFFREINDSLQLSVQSPSDPELSVELGRIITRTKNTPKFRDQMRQYLEPRIEEILDAINQEVLGDGTEELKRCGLRGLVLIVDDLDRVDHSLKVSGRTQPEYLFIDQGTQLHRLNCHVVYSIPLMLLYSHEYNLLKNRLGGGVPPKVLPMLPVPRRDGSDCEEAIALLRQVVLVRAFPDVEASQRLSLISEVFDSPETLDRLCRISGGHERKLLGLLYKCFQRDDPPISRNCLEKVIDEYRKDLVLVLDEHEWDLLFQVVQQQRVRDEAQYLLRTMFIFEYQDEQGRWFSINPVLVETEKFKALAAAQQSSNSCSYYPSGE